VLIDKNIKVRSTMAQLIMALASHDYLSLEGGSVLVQFLVDQCNISDEEVDKVRWRVCVSAPDCMSRSVWSRVGTDIMLGVLTTT
jgi:hypothetical protein